MSSDPFGGYEFCLGTLWWTAFEEGFCVHQSLFRNLLFEAPFLALGRVPGPGIPPLSTHTQLSSAQDHVQLAVVVGGPTLCAT